jgi:type IV pilus assembly protein PilQ
VSTLNNVVAEIKQGLTFPVPVTANQTTTVQFRDATLKLTVTPQITASNTVIMQIQLANETPDFGRQVLGIPSIITQSANTSVLVSDGQTTVIGGIYVSTATSATDRTPGLGRIPILGWLFRRDSVEDVNSELLIFITPRIIQGVTQ